MVVEVRLRRRMGARIAEDKMIDKLFQRLAGYLRRAPTPYGFACLACRLSGKMAHSNWFFDERPAPRFPMIELLFARRASSVAYASDRERNLAFDGLRVCAALSVLVAHIWSNAPWSTGVGQAGIRLFFAISGYCIFLSIDLAERRTIGHFIIGRVFRLYPAYWLSILLVLVLLDTSYPLLQILANTTMAQRHLGAGDIVNVYWTLFYELIFYAIACALIFTGYIRRIDATLVMFVGTLVLALSAGIVRGFFELKIQSRCLYSCLSSSAAA